LSDNSPLFQIKDLHVSVEGKKILNGIDLSIKAGELHAVMGPNGSGKSTLSYTVMGHPKYKVESGQILFKGQDIVGLKPNERAITGLFLAFQYPVAVPGVSVVNFLRTAMKAVRKQDIPVKDFRKELKEKMKWLSVDAAFANRYLNEGFSGGEKKRLEILQMALLAPPMAILDETDSGLDIDSLKIVSEGINRMATPERGMLLITHYQRLLDYVKPHFVHVLMGGRIVKSGGPDLARQLEAKGYEAVAQEVGAGASK
jgi:Fe-S cluster assembly ATP-binding protein